MADWSIPFDELARRSNKKLEDVVRLSTIEIFKRVVLRTPVDTGRARGAWVTGYGKPNVTIATGEDKTGMMAVRQMHSQVMAFPIGGIVYLTNSLPYIHVLEYGLYPNPPKMGSQKRGESGMTIHVIGGYSMQAPAGMVRKTLIEFDAAVRALIKG